jgi:pyruvate dehydrogenase E2 component (dihydrolipoamide acetyltransferase)
MSTEGIAKLTMPKWGLSMTEGTIVEWLVDEGDEVRVGQEVVEVATDKIDSAVENRVAGVLRRRTADVGDTIPVGGLLGVVADPSVPEAEIDAFVEEFAAAFVPEEEGEQGPQPEAVDLDGRRIRFLHLGEGPPIVLVHGFGGDLDNWMFNRDALAEVGSVWALDLPGHGGSAKEVGTGDLAELAGVLDSFLAGQGLERVHLVGHSLGGAVVTAFAAAHPDRVASLTVIDGAGLGPDINASYIEGFIAARSRKQLKPVLEMLFADPGLVTRQLIDDVLKYKRLDGVPEALTTLAGRLFPDGRQVEDLSSRLAQVRAPTLVIWGSEDRILPPEHAGGVGDGVRVEVLQGAGHSPQMEAAGDVNRLITEFVKGAADIPD